MTPRTMVWIWGLALVLAGLLVGLVAAGVLYALV